jgi:hypothetical protein
MANKLAMLVTTALVSTAVVFADAPFATAMFEREIEGSDKRVPISSATLGDLVCLTVRDVSTPSGDHSYRLVIYDGRGNEVHQSITRITARENKWVYVSCYSLQKGRDMPGTWWYVAELDDQPLISKELKVTAGG